MGDLEEVATGTLVWRRSRCGRSMFAYPYAVRPAHNSKRIWQATIEPFNERSKGHVSRLWIGSADSSEGARKICERHYEQGRKAAAERLNAAGGTWEARKTY